VENVRHLLPVDSNKSKYAINFIRSTAAVLSSTLNLTCTFVMDSYELPSAEDTSREAPLSWRGHVPPKFLRAGKTQLQYLCDGQLWTAQR